MYKLGELTLAVGLAMTSAAFPAMAQQAQQQMPMQQGQQQMPMMGHGMMMGGQPGMMGGQQGMMGSGMGMGMGGCPMMSGMMGSGMQGMGGPGMQGMMGQGMPMMGSGMQGMGGPGMQGMMGQGMPMMGSGMQGMMGMGCPWCGPGMMGSGYAIPQVNVNLSVSDVTSYLERWAVGNPNIKVGNVVEKDANTITADILTKDKDALVQRYTFDRRTGFYRPMQQEAPVP
jgi:hypothetical protein